MGNDWDIGRDSAGEIRDGLSLHAEIAELKSAVHELAEVFKTAPTAPVNITHHTSRWRDFVIGMLVATAIFTLWWLKTTQSVTAEYMNWIQRVFDIIMQDPKRSDEQRRAYIKSKEERDARISD